MANSINDAIRRINGIISDVKVIGPKVELYAANMALGIILHRVFNEGKAADGSLIGTYDDTKKQTFLTKKVEKNLTKKQRAILAKKRLKIGKGNTEDFQGFTYKELRAFRGLQTNYVDLQFTGKLHEMIQVGGKDGKVVVGIVDKQRAKVADYMEEKYGKVIFALGKEEKLQVMEKTSIFAKEEFSKILKKWSK